MTNTILAAGLALICLGPVYADQVTDSPQQTMRAGGASSADVEEVFVYLAVRSNRTPGASDPACDDAGFPVRNRNDSELRALSLTPASGRVDRNVGETLGSSVACFSARSETGRTQFFSKMVINGIAATGRGECMQQYSDFPEARVGVQDCWLKLEGLPKGYVGGFVTTSTVATRLADAAAAADCAGGPCGRGLESDPPGYVLPAVVTARLWKVRQR
jgi:hypothetical protein